jgi:hypothetical protein
MTLSHGSRKVPDDAVDEELSMATSNAELQTIVNELHLACVLDEHGKEVPITREMIERACLSLLERCDSGNHAAHRRNRGSGPESE